MILVAMAGLQSRRGAGSVPGTAFDPATLFAGGAEGAWHDASDLSSLWQDAAGTVPVAADGDPVALWQDRSGNGHHLVQTETAKRATWRTDGTLSWVAFDGTAILAGPPGFGAGSDPVHVFLAGDMPPGIAKNDGFLFAGRISGGEGLALAFNNDTTTKFDIVGTALGLACDVTAPAVYDAAFVADAIRGGVDGSGPASVAAAKATDGGPDIVFGRGAAGANPSRIFGAIRLGREATQAERADTVAHLAERAGLAL